MNRIAVSTTMMVALLGAGADASAQLAHYWGNHFGNESVLLNGAVIGSATDPGAVFYNPARLLHQAAPAFVASAKLYEWNSIRVKDGLGEGIDLEQSRFGGAPGFLVGTFTLPFLEGHQFAYGILTRYRAGASFYVREERAADLLDFLPGEDTYLGYVDFGTELKDDWMGLSWARGLSEEWSVGASLFWYDRSFSRRASVDLRAISETMDAAALEVERSYGAKDKGLAGKLGVAWRRGDLSLGASATLPYLSLSSKGSLRFDNFSVGVPPADGGPVVNVLESTVQSGLPVEWRTPWSLGAGAGWTRGAWQFHAAWEYFGPVGAHVLLTAQPDTGQSTGAPIEYTVVEERAEVLNGGAGVRWTSTGDLSAFASVVTNFSAAPDSVIEFTALQPVVSHTSQHMDFLLFGGGISIRTKWADLTLGATWQASSEWIPRLVTIPDGEQVPDNAEAQFKWDQWRFLFGFSIPLVEEHLGSLPGVGGS